MPTVLSIKVEKILTSNISEVVIAKLSVAKMLNDNLNNFIVCSLSDGYAGQLVNVRLLRVYAAFISAQTVSAARRVPRVS